MVRFDAAHGAVHYPPDRRFRIWIRPSILIAIGIAILSAIAAAWIEVAVAGMPRVPAVPQIDPNNFAGPHGFPVWVRYCHFFNFLFVMMLIRSGLSILMDHPRLYFNDGCTPGSEWIRFTPLKVPRDRIWTAKDDARYISPLVGTPGYRHTIGIARVWHFIDVHGFIVTGIIFIVMLFDTEQWRRIVPTSPLVLLQAWNTFVHYATFHLPPEPNGFYGYNALQQIAYFTVVFVFGPLAIATRHSDVSGGSEPVSVVRADIRGPAISPFYPLPDHVQLPCIFGRARDADRDDGICAQYEPHRDGYRRSEAYRNVSRIRRNRRGRALMDRGALHFLAPSARSAACTEVSDVSNAASYAESACCRSRGIRKRKSLRISGRMERCRSAMTGSTWQRVALTVSG